MLWLFRLFTLYPFAENILPADKCMIWSGWDGLVYQPKIGNEKIFAKEDFNYSNPFYMANDMLYYFSDSRNGIVIVSSTLEFIELEYRFKKNEGIGLMYVSGNDLLLNIVEQEKHVGVIKVDLHSHAQEVIREIDEVRCNVESGHVSERRGNRIFTKTGQLDVEHDLETLTDWDYDDVNNVLVWTNGESIFIEGDKPLKFKPSKWLPLPFRHSAIVPSQKQIWVSVDFPFTSGSKLLAFSYSGKLKGCLAFSGMSIVRPFFMRDPQIKTILEKL